MKSHLYGKTQISFGKLAEWCEIKNDGPIEIDKGFKFHHIESENSSLLFFVTTLRFLSMLKMSNLFTTDASYKLIWQGFLCIVVGVLDNNKSFHPIGFIVCDSEDCDDFEFVFKSIKEFEPNYKPRFWSLMVLML